MKNEHPILFSTPMVQATIKDTKTVTRRTRGLEDVNTNPKLWEFKRIISGHAIAILSK